MINRVLQIFEQKLPLEYNSDFLTRFHNKTSHSIVGRSSFDMKSTFNIGDLGKSLFGLKNLLISTISLNYPRQRLIYALIDFRRELCYFKLILEVAVGDHLVCGFLAGCPVKQSPKFPPVAKIFWLMIISRGPRQITPRKFHRSQ